MTDGAPPRRGRPPGRVNDLPPPEGYSHHPETRVGWLLRGWRLERVPDSSARSFAELLRGQGVSADASRVSRWETGQLPAPVEVLTAYESVLRLAPGGMLGVTAFQRRVASGGEPSGVGDPPERIRPRQLQRVLDVVVDGAPTGRDWLELGMTASSLGERLVLPRSVWARIAARLVSDVGRSVANAYVTRAECATLLTTHPSSRRALVLAVGEQVTTPGNFLLTDPMSILQEVDGAQANDLVLRLLEQPRPALRNAAAWAAATKVVRGHFGAEELTRLEQVLARIAAEQGLEDASGVSRLVDVAAVLPEESRTRILRARRGTGDQPPGRHPVEALDRAVLARVVAEVTRAAAGDDPMARSLVGLALGHEQAERRFLAAFTLQVSHLRAQVAAACADQVTRHLAADTDLGTELVYRLLVVLSIVAGEPERGLLSGIAVGPDPRLQPLALTCLAHLPPPTAALPGLADLVVGAGDDVARSALYCAGMTADPRLEDVVADDSVVDWRRHAATWWLRHGAAIHEPPPGIPGADLGTGPG